MASIAKFDVWQNTAGVGYNSVLQVINRQLDGTTQAIPTTADIEVQLTGWSQTITKLQPNSKIVCFIDFYNYQNTTPTGWWQLRCKVGGSPVTSSTGFGIRSENPVQWNWRTSSHQMGQAMFWDIRNATTVTYDFYHGSVSSNAGIIWWNNPVNWTFYEIAQ